MTKIARIAVLTLGLSLLVPVTGRADCNDSTGQVAGAVGNGLVYGLLGRFAGLNVDNAKALGGTVSILSYAQRQSDCARQVQMDALRREYEYRRQAAYEAQRQAEFERNNRCIARTYEVNGQLVSDTRECMHVQEGQPYQGRSQGYRGYRPGYANH
jgi:hypothetical protein